MIIKVTLDPSDGVGSRPEEWIILELQGKVVPIIKPGDGAGSEDASAPLDGLMLGHLTMKSDGKGATLQLGNHRVPGALETLPKPLVLLDRDPSSSSRSSSSRPGSESSPEELHGQPFSVKAVIRRKLRFEDRPQPIIGGGGSRRVGGR